ncbi:MAG: T9SS type A sorting domain-containing protein [Saprospiraceae bacterium]
MIYFRRVLMAGFLCLCLSMGNSLHATALNGFYVNDFREILGNTTKENKLLSFAEANDFNYLILYNLRSISDNSYDLTKLKTANVLANFIRKAKEDYGIVAIAAVGQQFSSFKTIDAYNKLWALDDIRKIDVYHLEFEFWNQNFLATEWESTDVDAAFEFYMNQLNFVKNQALLRNVKCETYIGNITPEACAAIGAVADRILVHYYRTSDFYNNGNSIYQYKAYRLAALAPVGDKVLEVLPLFSARPHFMGPWLETHDLEEAFDTFLYGQNGHAAQTGDWKEKIDLIGYSWYRYSDLQSVLGKQAPSIQATAGFKNNNNELDPPGVYFKNGKETKETTESNKISTHIFPQPADDQLTIEVTETIQSVVVLNMQGQQISKGIRVDQSSMKTLRFSTKTWHPGMYLIYISTATQAQKVCKVLVQH